MRAIEKLPLEDAQAICSILEAQFTDGKSLFRQPGSALVAMEPVYLDLVEVMFPSKLYLADFADAPARRGSRKPGKRRYFKKGPSERDLVWAALKRRGLKFSCDWVSNTSQIITFHDLNNRKLPLAEVVDQGTVEYCSPEEFCRISADHEHVFKGLLRQCLQQKVIAKGIKWQHKEKLFIFVDRNGEEIREERWEGIDSPSRKVYERTMKKDKPEEILNCKHLAFSTEFRRYGNRWLLLVKPEWFFSFDGFHRNRFASKNVDWLKRHEWNTQVFNHFKFIVRFINYEAPADLFNKAVSGYPFLAFRELVALPGSPALDDKEWLSAEEQARRSRVEGGEGILPFPI